MMRMTLRRQYRLWNLRQKRSLRKMQRKGFLLPMTAVLVVILSISGLCVMALGSSSRLRTAHSVAEIGARMAADAGFTRALFEMNQELNTERWDFGSLSQNRLQALPAVLASYEYEIEEIQKDSVYRITSTGTSGFAHRTVSATLQLGGLFDQAIFAQGYAVPKHPKGAAKYSTRPKAPKKGGKVQIKGYNVAVYDPDTKGKSDAVTKVRTNSSHKRPIKLEGKIDVDADIVVGPGAQPDKSIELKDGARANGRRYAASQMDDLPPIAIPPELQGTATQKYEYKEGEPLTGNLRFDELKIPKDKTQEVVGDCVIYVTKKMKIEEGANLVITKDASLTIYVEDQLEVKQKKDDPYYEAPKEKGSKRESYEQRGIVNTTLNASNLRIYATDECKKVKIEEVGDFYGAVYAPRTKVELKKTEDIYGALIGWDVKIETKDKKKDIHTFYYDQRLRSGVRIDEDGARFVVKSWNE